MPVVSYTARRALVSGVTAGQAVVYDLPVRWAGINRERRVFASQRRALSGRRETYYESAEYLWAIATKPLTSAQQLPLLMFLESHEQGESFSFGPAHYASDGGSIVYVSTKLESLGYTEPRDAGLDSLIAYSFSIVQVP